MKKITLPGLAPLLFCLLAQAILQAQSFIPSADQEKVFRTALTSSPNCCDGIPLKKVDYEIVYNQQDGCRCFFKNGENLTTAGTAKHKFRPREGKDLYFRIVSYHPYRDSLAVSVQFKNRNEEFGEQFRSTITAGFPDMPKTGELPSSLLKSYNLKDMDSVKNLLTDFRDEMAQFYARKKADPTVSLAFLKPCVDLIQRNVTNQFKAENSSPEAVFNRGIAIIADLDSIANEEELLKILRDGIANYRKVLTYNTQTTFAPVQIQNADVTEVNFQWFRDGKPTQSTPATYFNRGGFKIDFSAGLVGHGLVDQNFTTTPVQRVDSSMQGTPPMTVYDTTTQARIIRQKSSDFTVDGGVFAHFYTRNSCWRRTNFSFTIGAVPTKRNDQLRMRYLAGFSVLLGSEQRLVITTGVIGGNVTRLAENLKAGDNGTLLDPPKGEPLVVATREVFRGHCFLALTFNFGTVSPK